MAEVGPALDLDHIFSQDCPSQGANDVNPFWIFLFLLVQPRTLIIVKRRALVLPVVWIQGALRGALHGSPPLMAVQSTQLSPSNPTTFPRTWS